MEDALSGQKVAVEASGTTPLALALSLAKSIVGTPVLARQAFRAPRGSQEVIVRRPTSRRPARRHPGDPFSHRLPLWRRRRPPCRRAGRAPCTSCRGGCARDRARARWPPSGRRGARGLPRGSRARPLRRGPKGTPGGRGPTRSLPEPPPRQVLHVGRARCVVGRQDHEPLDHVAQLAHVAGEAVGGELGERVVGDRSCRGGRWSPWRAQEVLRELGDVVAARRGAAGWRAARR